MNPSQRAWVELLRFWVGLIFLYMAFGSLNIFFMGGRAGNLHFDLNSLMLVVQVAALAMGAGQTYAIDAWMRHRAQPRELTAT